MAIRLALWGNHNLTRVLLNLYMSCLSNSVDPDQLASEANWSGSALFAIQYMNLYQQSGSSTCNLKIWKRCGILIYSAGQGLMFSWRNKSPNSIEFHVQTELARPSLVQVAQPHFIALHHEWSLTLVLLNPDIPYLCKQCRSRSVGFWRSQLIWICTVCH